MMMILGLGYNLGIKISRDILIAKLRVGDYGVPQVTSEGPLKEIPKF